MHAGSLIAALASWLDARSQGGRWLLRIEDIDTPRCSQEHAERIIDCLQGLGLHWDGPVLYQSQRLQRYQLIFDRLRHAGALFPCACSRRQLKREQGGGHGEVRYPGTCRDGLPEGAEARTWRFRISDQPEFFTDRLAGDRLQNPARQCGDFVVLRADGLFAYQLVVVVDDADQGVTDIVRGADLLSSTGRQLQLYRALGEPPPRYLHIPLLLDKGGYKLSKQTGAQEIPWQQSPVDCLNQALSFLGQPTQAGPPEQLLRAATRAWDPSRIPTDAIFSG